MYKNISYILEICNIDATTTQ